MWVVSETPAPSRQVVRFGAFELDLRAGELRKAGLRVNLQEQPFKVLECLVERPGELVTRQELRQRLELLEQHSEKLEELICRLEAHEGHHHRLENEVETLRHTRQRLPLLSAEEEPQNE